jgi:hypothetical protein
MNTNLEELSLEFKDNLNLDYDLKKKIGLISVEKLKFIIKQKILKN